MATGNNMIVSKKTTARVLSLSLGSLSKDVFRRRNFDPKCALLHFNMPCCYQICLVKLLYSYTDDLSEKTAKVAAQKGKTSTSGWRASVVQKWPCLSSPILWYTQSNATRLKLMFLRDHNFKWLNLSNIGEVMDLRPNSWGFRKIARRVFIAPLKNPTML